MASPSAVLADEKRPRPWRDVREWIERVEALGELREASSTTPKLRPVLFDRVSGYATGRRVIVNCNGTPGRQALTLGLPRSMGNHEATA